MKFFKMDIKTIALIILAIIVIYDAWQNSKGDKKSEIIKVDGKKYELVKRTVDTVVKTRTQVKWIKGNDIYHETVVEKRIEVPVLHTKMDTLKILKEFYSKVIFKDTLKLDGDMGMISLIDTISKNKILGRKWNAYLKEKTIKETTIVKELPKNQVYFGFNGGFNKEDIVNNVSTGFLLKTKTDKIYQLNVGVSNNNLNGQSKLSPYVGVGVYWKIKLKK